MLRPTEENMGATEVLVTHMHMKIVTWEPSFVTTVWGHYNVLFVMYNGFFLICLFCFMAELFSSMDGIARQRYSTWMHQTHVNPNWFYKWERADEFLESLNDCLIYLCPTLCSSCQPVNQKLIKIIMGMYWARSSSWENSFLRTTSHITIYTGLMGRPSPSPAGVPPVSHVP